MLSKSIHKFQLMKNCPAYFNARKVTAKTESKTKSEEMQISSEKIESNYDNALPYENMPSPSNYQLFRYYLPGGKLYKVPKKDFSKVLFKEFGPILRIAGMFGKNDFVLTKNPQDFETIFRTESIWPFRAPLETVYHYRKEKHPELFKVGGLTIDQNEDWGHFRSIVNPILMQPRTIKMYITKMDTVASEFLKRIYNIRNANTLEVPGTFINDINNWTLESVCVVALDTSLGLINDSEKNSDAKLLISTVSKFLKYLAELEFSMPIWKLVRTPTYYKHMEIMDTLTNLSTKFINNAIEKYAKINETIDNRNEAEKSVLERLLKIDKQIAVVMAIDMITGGVDTTASAFTSCLLSLTKNPGKQKILRKEIMAALPNKNSPLTVVNMNELPYLRACIKEGLRLYPVVSASSRRTKQEIVLSGYKVPAGVDVALLADEFYHNDEFFTSAKNFIPERWLRNGSDCPVSENPMSSFIYMPFGLGPRSCVARRLVNLELEVALARIVRNFQVEFNYPLENMFQTTIISSPIEELKFKFIDL